MKIKFFKNNNSTEGIRRLFAEFVQRVFVSIWWIKRKNAFIYFLSLEGGGRREVTVGR